MALLLLGCGGGGRGVLHLRGEVLGGHLLLLLLMVLVLLVLLRHLLLLLLMMVVLRLLLLLLRIDILLLLIAEPRPTIHRPFTLKHRLRAFKTKHLLVLLLILRAHHRHSLHLRRQHHPKALPPWRLLHARDARAIAPLINLPPQRVRLAFQSPQLTRG